MHFTKQISAFKEIKKLLKKLKNFFNSFPSVHIFLYECVACYNNTFYSIYTNIIFCELCVYNLQEFSIYVSK